MTSAVVVVFFLVYLGMIPIDWKAHARVGVPVSVATLAIVALYLAARAS